MEDVDALAEEEGSWEDVVSGASSSDAGGEGSLHADEKELLAALKGGLDLMAEMSWQIVIRAFTAEAGHARASKQQRRAITKQQRAHAAMLHQASVLCLTARTLLLDQAADDAFVQVSFLSQDDESGQAGAGT